MESIMLRSLRPWHTRPFQGLCQPCRSLTTSVPRLSGHNKWSTIKHDKAKNDKAKGRERGLVSKEISSATQRSGPNPKDNARLVQALANAKRIGLPKHIIDTAIARGQGISLSGKALEAMTCEAMLPHSVAVVIECQTDLKTRTLQDVRHAIKTRGGTSTPTTFLFEKKGRIIFEKKDGLDPDDYMEQAIEAGATDIGADEEGRLYVLTEPAGTKSVGESLSKLTGLAVDVSEIIWDPNPDTLVELKTEEQIKETEDTIAFIREVPAVQDIYLNTTQRF
ncbi:post-initiation translation factor DPC29 [Aspergillus affinis]|uniref:post-initiation translation factor DPC29 n=1 Tax=Aspergillus affinis TaxID=1070780 RepID=UPI0022FF29CC|nr:DUF28 domain protein [Aspergillus affinis]KAI9036682.1 DUF28 domain protein [Aspergillus affinis]